MSLYSRPWSPVATVVVCVVALVLLLGSGAQADDHIQVHSLLPPILKNYWANGMQFWAFGRETVITDGYVQLTTLAPTSQGYLWNRHKNQLDAFALNVTVQMRSRDGSWFAPGGDSGFGVWYASDPKVNYQTDAAFFGFKRRFRGIGVVLDHSNELHVFESDGSVALSPTTMRRTRAGGCTLSSLGELHATLSLVYEERVLKVFYTMHHGEEPEPQDYEYSVLCASVDGLALTSSYHFGVTAANSANGQAVHTIHSVVMTPLSDVSMHVMEEEMVGQARLFEDPVPVGAEAAAGADTEPPTTSVPPTTTVEPAGQRQDEFEGM